MRAAVEVVVAVTQQVQAGLVLPLRGRDVSGAEAERRDLRMRLWGEPRREVTLAPGAALIRPQSRLRIASWCCLLKL